MGRLDFVSESTYIIFAEGDLDHALSLFPGCFSSFGSSDIGCGC